MTAAADQWFDAWLDANSVRGLVPAHCLCCGIVLNASTRATPTQQIEPCAGAITICAYCGHPQAFTNDPSKLRELTAEESRHPAVICAVVKWHTAYAKAKANEDPTP